MLTTLSKQKFLKHVTEIKGRDWWSMSFTSYNLKYYIQKNVKKKKSLQFTEVSQSKHTHVTTTQIKKQSITSTLEAPTAILTQSLSHLPSLLKLWTYIYQENTTREMEKVKPKTGRRYVWQIWQGTDTQNMQRTPTSQWRKERHR